MLTRRDEFAKAVIQGWYASKHPDVDVSVNTMEALAKEAYQQADIAEAAAGHTDDSELATDAWWKERGAITKEGWHGCFIGPLRVIYHRNSDMHTMNLGDFMLHHPTREQMRLFARALNLELK